jgi:pimeloyl-ACP methyl ester carboxylesterase
VLVALIIAVFALSGAEADAFQAELRYTKADDTKIAWYERGQGKPLLMLQGTGSTLSEWDPALIRLLSKKHRLIFIDYPGLGKSGPWRGKSFDSLSETISRYLAKRDLGEVNVLGWSMGGFVAQRLAINHPEQVSRLILAGTNPGSVKAQLGTKRAQRIDSMARPSRRQILSLLYPRRRLDEGKRFLKRLVWASQKGVIPNNFNVPKKTVDKQVKAESPWLRSSRNLNQLRDLQVKTLVSGGRHDPVIPRANLRLLKATIPKARLEVFAGAHAFLYQERRRFSALVSRFTR